ncbi:hypothetical protein L1987_77672 [Smallanthus sonchifolius]|uniref:Uncharacterized protein n=1 Tax=Smallanthus sonchifolius TaxID=185202 RepID=A0ACB8ZAT2_9ASTR|nr:hypothetical protein L1987_77672 [Smallanthus sonchifolius]
MVVATDAAALCMFKKERKPCKTFPIKTNKPCPTANTNDQGYLFAIEQPASQISRSSKYIVVIKTTKQDVYSGHISVTISE